MKTSSATAKIIQTFPSSLLKIKTIAKMDDLSKKKAVNHDNSLANKFILYKQKPTNKNNLTASNEFF